MHMFGKNRRKLGDILVDAGKISKEQLEYSLELQKKRGDKLGKILVDEGLLSEDDVLQGLEFQLGVPRAALERYYIEPGIARLIPESLARRHNAIAIKKYNEVLTVAMSDPLNVFAVDELKLVTGYKIQPAIASEDDIRSAVEFYYGRQTAEKAVEDFEKEYKVEKSAEPDKELLDHVNNAPVVRLVNSIIEQAVLSRASDIHIEPRQNDLRIRFRIDGELHDIMATPMDTHGSVVARIKIMSNLNIAERRLPQDGRVKMDASGRNLDLRISIMPTVFGEKVVVRLLDRGSFMMTKKQLGFTQENIRLYDKLLKAPCGIILVTGPTGSGKTTTLYSALKELNDSTANIITLEDPVEYTLEGINQVQVNPKAGLTFAGGLRSILRQDPNIIMVGEIRDEETAKLAVRAAITGHLVLSTMHTNDASGSVVRLIDMGVEPYLAASSVMGVISQRLVRKVCPDCRKGYKPGADELKLMGLGGGDGITLYKGQGCSSCNGTGYKERTAVHEIMTITGRHRDLINRRASSDKLARLSAELGMKTLKDNCAELVKTGITTVEEMIKVVYFQE